MSVNTTQCTRKFFLQAVTGHDDVKRSKKGTFLYLVDNDYVWIHRSKEETKWVAGHKPTREKVFENSNVRTKRGETDTRRLLHVIVIATQSEFYHHIERGDIRNLEWYAFPTWELNQYAHLSGDTYHITERNLDDMEHFYQDEIGYLPSTAKQRNEIPQHKWISREKFDTTRQQQEKQGTVEDLRTRSGSSTQRTKELREVYLSVVKSENNISTTY